MFIIRLICLFSNFLRPFGFKVLKEVKKSLKLKIITFYVFTILFAVNNYSQQTSLLKSTITSVGSTSVSISNNKYFIAQSIGQTGIIGKVDENSLNIQQGFLTHTLSFTIDNSKVNSVEEVFDFVISPNPFVEYIKIHFSKKTKKDVYIKIYDMNGKIYKNLKSRPSNEIVLPLNRLSIGNYLIQIKTGSNRATKKIFKIK